MDIKFSSIADRGDLAKERIAMVAKSGVDIGRFMLVRTRMNEGTPTTEIDFPFWFPNTEVKAGDRIVLYTKIGEQSQRLEKDGKTVHFLYANYAEAIWEDDGCGPVLFDAPKWSFKPASDLAR